MKQKGLIRPGDAAALAVMFLEKVNLQEFIELYSEQAKLLAKTQLMLDSLAEYAEEVQKGMPEIADMTEINSPFRVKWEYNDGLLKVVIPGQLPRLNYYDKDWRVIRDDIVKRLLRGLKDLPPEIKFNRAYCVFRMYYCLRHSWDAQNRAYQAVLNALAMKKLLPDDSINHVISVLAGKQIEKGEPEHTEVYLFSVEDFDRFRHIIHPNP